jgi:hypothetical protein
LYKAEVIVFFFLSTRRLKVNNGIAIAQTIGIFLQKNSPKYFRGKIKIQCIDDYKQLRALI